VFWPSWLKRESFKREKESVCRSELLMPALSGRLVGEVRLKMLERGFALVNTPRCFDSGLCLRLRKERTVLPFLCEKWWRFPELAVYACWLERLLHEALPDESPLLDALEYRHEPAGSEDKGVDRLHADGSYIRSTCTLYGRTTVYRDGKIERSVPSGKTLLMTALARARAVGVPCTLHRRPGAGPERAVIVCSFEPRRQHDRAVGVYRQAVQAE
jgi:hypothetical protein